MSIVNHEPIDIDSSTGIPIKRINESFGNTHRQITRSQTTTLKDELTVALDFDGVVAYSLKPTIKRLRSDSDEPWRGPNEIDHYNWVSEEFGRDNFREAFNELWMEDYQSVNPMIRTDPRSQLNQMAYAASIDIVTQHPTKHASEVVQHKREWLCEYDLDKYINQIISVNEDVVKADLGHDIIIDDSPYHIRQAYESQTPILIHRHYNRPAVISMDESEYIRGLFRDAANITYAESLTM